MSWPTRLVCRGTVDAFLLLGIYLRPRQLIAIHNHRSSLVWDGIVGLIGVVCFFWCERAVVAADDLFGFFWCGRAVLAA